MTLNNECKSEYENQNVKVYIWTYLLQFTLVFLTSSYIYKKKKNFTDTVIKKKNEIKKKFPPFRFSLRWSEEYNHPLTPLNVSLCVLFEMYCSLSLRVSTSNSLPYLLLLLTNSSPPKSTTSSLYYHLVSHFFTVNYFPFRPWLYLSVFFFLSFFSLSHSGERKRKWERENYHK